MRRVRLSLLPGLEVEFTDRDAALRQVEDWAREGTRWPIVIFGPEGCGKSALLRQAAAVLRDLGYDVVYVDPLHRFFTAHTDVNEIARKLADAASEAFGIAQLKLATLAIDAIKELLDRWGRRRVAVLVDEAFQAVGLDKAGIYVKSLLNLIEYPPRSYDGIVAVVATSEGVSRSEIGRHRWADAMPMWNMPREGLHQLYEKIPGPKPPFEEVWRLTGGNPGMLSRLYLTGWNSGAVVTRLIREKGLTPDFIARWRGWLERAVEDPEALWSPDAPEELVRRLVERNLILYNIYEREQIFWVDQPPPERDPELGVGRDVAWQTPLHREAVRRVLEAV
ncbi:MAG: AAA family ATPase [Pyrobaculum sp. JCHS_4]|jgi:Archaeal ATPase.|nr:MAG: AAA family ATPase [Pyrobaculum sp. JCHS_4]